MREEPLYLFEIGDVRAVEGQEDVALEVGDADDPGVVEERLAREADGDEVRGREDVRVVFGEDAEVSGAGRLVGG